MGITTRAPRSLSDRHRSAGCGSRLTIGGRSFQPLDLLTQRARLVPISTNKRAHNLPAKRARPHLDGEVAASADAALACHLVPAMAQGLPLRLAGRPDSRLLENLPRLMQTLAAWNLGLRTVPVEYDAPRPDGPLAARSSTVGAFFTGGVDSCHTLLLHRDEIDCLVYVVGFDIRPSQTRLWAATEAMLREVCRHYGKRLVVVESNLRDYLDPFLGWNMAHGAGLAAVAHVLAPSIGTMLVPSTFSRAQLRPLGSHPDLDPLWSSDRVQIVHDTFDRTRLEKVRELAADGVALRYLRVCWANPDESYNCGRCPKCVRTQLALEVVGVRDRAVTFPGPLQVSHIEGLGSLAAMEAPERAFYAELEAGFRAAGRGEDPLAAALRRLLAVAPAQPAVVAAPAPDALTVGPAQVAFDGRRVHLTAPVRHGGVATELFVTYEAEAAPPRPGDALLVWFVLQAMRLGAPLRVMGEVSRDLLAHVEQAQRVWATLPVFSGVRVVPLWGETPAAPLEAATPELPWVAAFGGGVDGWYTALQNRARLRYLLFLHGIDQEIPDPEYREVCSERVRGAADALGLRLLEVDTNLRRIIVSELGGLWDDTYTVAPMGLAHLLQPLASRLLIGGSCTYRQLSYTRLSVKNHPLLDRWVSAAAMRVETDAMDCPRPAKIAWLCREHPWSVKHLWVCYARLTEGHRGGMNCGVCEKCLRTLAAFRVAGALDLAASVFDRPFDLDRYAAAPIPHGALGEILVLVRLALLRELRARGQDEPLQQALVRAIARAEGAWPCGTERVLEDPFPRWRASPAWGACLSRQARLWLAPALEGAREALVLDVALRQDPDLGILLTPHILDRRLAAGWRRGVGAVGRGWRAVCGAVAGRPRVEGKDTASGE